MKKLIKTEYHRNGLISTAYNVIIFKDDDGSKKIGIIFDTDDEHCIAVFNKDLLDKDIIEFGKNSWIGDNYSDDLKKMIEKENTTEMNFDNVVSDIIEDRIKNVAKEEARELINMDDNNIEKLYELMFNKKIKIVR